MVLNKSECAIQRDDYWESCWELCDKLGEVHHYNRRWNYIRDYSHGSIWLSKKMVCPWHRISSPSCFFQTNEQQPHHLGHQSHISRDCGGCLVPSINSGMRKDWKNFFWPQDAVRFVNVGYYDTRNFHCDSKNRVGIAAVSHFASLTVIFRFVGN